MRVENRRSLCPSLLAASPSSFSFSSPFTPSFSPSVTLSSFLFTLVGPVFSPVIGWPARSTYKEGNFARKLKLKRAAPPFSLRRWPKGCACSLVREKGEIRRVSVTRQIYFYHASQSYPRGENSWTRVTLPGQLILLFRANVKYLSE